MRRLNLTKQALLGSVAALSMLAACTGGTSGRTSNDLSGGGTSSTLASETASVDERGCVTGNWTSVPGSAEDAPIRYESGHFVYRWAGEATTLEKAKAADAELEYIWATYRDVVGFEEPFCDTATKHKANINIDTRFALAGGVTGDRNMGMWIHPLSLADRWGLAHEYAHGLQGSTQGLRDSPYVGWLWESHANWMTHQMPHFRDEVHCSEMLVNYPHLYYGSTRNRYCNWQFLEYLKNAYGYKIVNEIWTKAIDRGQPGHEDEDPFSILMRNNGWSLSQLNDEFGKWAMHNVNWDYVDADGYDRGVTYRAKYGSYDSREGDRRLRVTPLVPVDASKRQYHVPDYWAPQRWGYNLVKLIPDAGATEITVTFRGVTQSAPATTTLPGLQFEPEAVSQPGSDWRWGVVVVDAEGKSRYSDLKSGADASARIALKPDDQDVYMVVVATPNVMQKIRWDQPYYSIYRYPWMAQFTGAQPEGYQAGVADPAGGHRHANGGGWVSDKATVAASAYVGPYAKVLGGTVSGNARIEDHAVIVNAEVSGNARVGAMSVLDRGVKVKDDAQIYTIFMGPGAFEPGAVIGGKAQIRGDIELRGAPNLTKGVFYGFADQAYETNPKAGGDLTAPVPEVTAKPRFVWRP